MTGIVYLLTNTVTGRYYVGQTTRTLRNRWNTHKSEARTRPHSPIQWDILKHGPEAFIVEELARADTRAELHRLERLWVVTLGSWRSDVGMNVSIGYKLHAETRAKMSASRTGRVLTMAHRAAVSAGNKGKPKSASHCAALKAARNRGRAPFSRLDAAREAARKRNAKK